MSDELRHFMVLLASDAELLSEFIADPRRTLQEANLSEADSDILLSGDQARLYAAIAPTPPVVATPSPPQGEAAAAEGAQPAAAESAPAAQASALQWPGAIVYVFPYPLLMGGYTQQAAQPNMTPQLYPTYSWAQMCPHMMVTLAYAAAPQGAQYLLWPQAAAETGAANAPAASDAPPAAAEQSQSATPPQAAAESDAQQRSAALVVQSQNEALEARAQGQGTVAGRSAPESETGTPPARAPGKSQARKRRRAKS